MAMYTLLYLKWITNKDLLYSQDGRAVWRKNGYTYIYG